MPPCMQTGTFILAKLRGAQRKDPGGEAPFKGRCHLCFLSLSVAGGVPQVFLTAPSGTVQIPVSAVQLHQVGAERYLRVFGEGGGCPRSAPACASGQTSGRGGPRVWESCQCHPPLGEEALPSLDRHPERTVPPWLLARRVLGHAVPSPQCFLLPFLSRWLSSGSRAAVAAA